jgi:hypothetical protein
MIVYPYLIKIYFLIARCLNHLVNFVELPLNTYKTRTDRRFDKKASYLIASELKSIIFFLKFIFGPISTSEMESLLVT